MNKDTKREGEGKQEKEQQEDMKRGTVGDKTIKNEGKDEMNKDRGRKGGKN